MTFVYQSMALLLSIDRLNYGMPRFASVVTLRSVALYDLGDQPSQREPLMKTAGKHLGHLGAVRFNHGMPMHPALYGYHCTSAVGERRRQTSACILCHPVYLLCI